MKETPIFEEVFMRTLRLRSLWTNVLIGGLLSFVPLLNFFAFGYLLRLSKALREGASLTLPDWSDWQGLFVDGLKFAVVWLAYWLLPLLLAFILASLLSGLGLFAIGYLVLSVVVLVSPVLFTSALYRYNTRSDFRALLDVALIIRMTCMKFFRFLVPSLAFAGICVLAAPLYGFALFFGFLIFIIHTSLVFRAIEQRRAVAL